jgi:hypothetical protein
MPGKGNADGYAFRAKRSPAGRSEWVNLSRDAVGFINDVRQPIDEQRNESNRVTPVLARQMQGGEA